MHVLGAEMRDRIAKGVTLDMIYVDVGVRSEAEARAKGIEILDPVTFSQDLASLANGRMAGTALGLKANVAVLTDLARAAAEGNVPQTTAFGWMVQTRLAARGSRSALGAALAKAKLAPKAAIVLGTIAADRGEKSPGLGKGPVVIQAKEGPMKLREAVEAAAGQGDRPSVPDGRRGDGSSGRSWPTARRPSSSPFPVKFAGTPSEVVDGRDIQALFDLVSDIIRTREAEMNARRISLLLLAALAAVSVPLAAQTPSDWDLLRTIVMIPGISSQEVKVMDWIASMLPKGVKVERDAKNDVWFTAGSGRPHILFVAHADELGMTVDKFTPQGTVLLRGRGGFLPQACEARPFVIHTAKGPVDGIMLPRPDYDARSAQPFALEPYELYVGADSEAEARALGIAPGDQVIFKKKIVDLGPDVMATRAVDDRAGCASLLAAALETDWSKLKGRTVTCAWSVEEEIGLNGASAIAKVLKPDYVFAIDTFVSTDSPLENKRFGDAELGEGRRPPRVRQLDADPQARDPEERPASPRSGGSPSRSGTAAAATTARSSSPAGRSTSRSPGRAPTPIPSSRRSSGATWTP